MKIMDKSMDELLKKLRFSSSINRRLPTINL